MRRSAFVGVLAAGVLASAWFSMQPLADPYNGVQRASRAQSLLPVAAPADAITFDAPAAEDERIEPSLTRRLKGLSVLAAEDNPLNRELNLISVLSQPLYGIVAQPGALPKAALEEVIQKVRDLDMVEVKKKIEAAAKPKVATA